MSRFKVLTIYKDLTKKAKRRLVGVRYGSMIISREEFDKDYAHPSKWEALWCKYTFRCHQNGYKWTWKQMTLWSCVLFTLACSTWHKLLAEECEERLKHFVNLMTIISYSQPRKYTSHKRLLEKRTKVRAIWVSSHQWILIDKYIHQTGYSLHSQWCLLETAIHIYICSGVELCDARVTVSTDYQLCYDYPKVKRTIEISVLCWEV